MPEYFTPVRSPIRWLAIIGLGLATPLFAAIVGILVSLLQRGKVQDAELPKLLGVIAFLSLLTCASGWMFIRLLRNKYDRNNVTIMPSWFIRPFGVLMLVATGVMVWRGDVHPYRLAGSTMVGLAMLFLPGLVPKPRARASDESLIDETEYNR